MSRWVRVQTEIFDHAVFAADPFSEREAWIWLDQVWDGSAIERLAVKFGWDAKRLSRFAKKIGIAGLLSAPDAERIEEFYLRKAARPGIPTAIKSAVLERDGDRCRYCGGVDGPFHIDHIYPWVKGGKHTVENLTVACVPCNMSKGSKTLEEWDGVQQ